MTKVKTLALVLFTLTALPACLGQKSELVTVEPGVKLEVLDYGGTGRPLIFLAGLGSDAHVYDQLAPHFTDHHHVLAITRRGFGNSSKPAPTVANYSADRLGDDVLAVIDALHLDHPVIAGHSIAGEELSSIGSRHPDKVAGLIYLDAADAYGFYDEKRGDWQLDMNDLKQRLDAVASGAPLTPEFHQNLLQSAERFKRSERELIQQLAMMPPGPPASLPPIPLAIRFGEQKYTTIHDPALAIFACPHNFARMFPTDLKARQAITAQDLTSCTAQAKAFQAAVPSAQIVLIPNADHWVFVSNEAEVVKDMKAFLQSLH
jgi:pimeloyl-ACP methyl ester carboxylesterase